jgi:hypothetical protein
MKKLDILMKDGHLSEKRTLAKVKKGLFWDDKTKSMRMVVRQWQRCQLAKSLRNIKSGIEEMKNIHVYDLFYRVALNTMGPCLKLKWK